MLRAIDALEMICSPAAVKLLSSLASGDADAWLTQEAAATLERARRNGVMR